VKGVQHLLGSAGAGHEVGKMGDVPSLGGIMIREELVVDEFDAESVRDNDDNALGSAWRSGRIRSEGVECLGLARGIALVDMAGEAFRTRHVDGCNNALVRRKWKKRKMRVKAMTTKAGILIPYLSLPEYKYQSLAGKSAPSGRSFL
jgi:hypothetical protein